MTDLVLLANTNAARWKGAKITHGDFATPAKKLVAAKSRYQVVEKRTGVPWFIIAVIHERECSQSWTGSLAQGDPWNKPSVHVPANRGPFKSWEDAAVDALVNCAPFAAKNTDWSAGGSLTMLERYNGLGYASGPVERHANGSVTHYPPQPSPYVWAGTSAYAKGKYVRDGEFDPNVVDQQLGCAGLILAMAVIDPSVKFIGPATSVPVVPVATTTTTQPAMSPFASLMARIKRAI
jgi:lysozyme family protein